MALWTDIIDPATLTGYARASLADYELSRGTLARWLPNRDVLDIVVRFVAGSRGLTDIARFRAYDAEPEIGSRPSGKRVTLELPALGMNIPITEYEQLRLRNADVDEAAALAAVQTATDIVVRAVADAAERLRGIVLATGKATIDQDNFKNDDDFGRSAGHQLVAASLWTTAAVSRLTYLETITDVYRETNGEEPGSIVMPTRVFRAFAAGDELQTQLLNGASRPATETQVQDTVSGAGFAPIFRYDRRVRVNGASVRALPDDTILLLPAAVDPNDWQATELGATFWGRTLTSTDPAWAIEDSEQPGIVAGVFKHEKPPMGLEVISDAVALPVLANPDLSLAAKVL